MGKNLPGPAVHLDSGGSVNFGVHAALEPTGDHTLEAWVYLQGTSCKGELFSCEVLPVSGFSWWVTTNGNQYYRTISPGGVEEAIGQAVLLLGVWYHLVAKRSGTTVTFYVNGQIDKVVTGITAPAAATAAFVLGSPSYGLLVQETAEYPTALSDARVLFHYQTGAATGAQVNAATTLSAGAAVAVVPPGSKYSANATVAGMGRSLPILYRGGNVSEITLPMSSGLSVAIPYVLDRWKPLFVPTKTGKIGQARSGNLRAGEQCRSNFIRSSYFAPIVYPIIGGTDYHLQLVHDSLMIEEVLNTQASIARFQLWQPLGNQYLGEVMADRPVGYWRLNDQGPTTVADQTGNYPGVASGNITFGQSGAGNGLPKAAVLITSTGSNRSTGLIDYGVLTALEPTGDLTLEAWVYITASPYPDATTNFTLVSSEVFQASGFIWRLDGGSGQQYYRTNQAGTYAGGYSNTGLPAGVWNHIAVKQVGTTVTFYLNGKPDGVIAGVSPPVAATVTFRLLNSNPATQAFIGYAQEIAEYPTGLSNARIQAHYQAGLLSGGGNAFGTVGPPLFADVTIGWGSKDNIYFSGRLTRWTQRRAARGAIPGGAVSGMSRFVYDIECSSRYQELASTLIADRVVYNSSPAGLIIKDLINKYMLPALPSVTFDVTGVESGPTIPYIYLDHVSVAQAITRIANVANYYWDVDPYNRVRFFSSTSYPSNLSLGQTSYNYDDWSQQEDVSQLRNYIVVRGAQGLVPQVTYNFTTDGTALAWILPNQPVSPGLVVTFGTAGSPSTSYSLGVDHVDQDANFDFLVDYTNFSFRQSSRFRGGVPLPVGDVLSLTSQHYVPEDVVVYDPASIATYGTRGYYVEDNSLLDLDTAVLLGKGQLAQYSQPIQQGTWTTWAQTIKVGDLVSVNLADRNFNKSILVQKLTRRMAARRFANEVRWMNVKLEWLDLIRRVNALTEKQNVPAPDQAQLVLGTAVAFTP